MLVSLSLPAPVTSRTRHFFFLKIPRPDALPRDQSLRPNERRGRSCRGQPIQPARADRAHRLQVYVQRQSCGQLETGPGGSIYPRETSRRYTSGLLLLFPPERPRPNTPAHQRLLPRKRRRCHRLQNFHPRYGHESLKPRTGEDPKGHLITVSANPASPLALSFSALCLLAILAHSHPFIA